MQIKTIGKIILGLVVTVIIAGFLSFRILQSPLGLTADEGGFGINAVLLANTLHDENGRFLPVFVLSLNGQDWRQPVTQYFLTGLFKVFSPSVFLLRFSSVVVAVVSFWLTTILAVRLSTSKWAIVAGLIFLTTPIILIHSHMGLDNIMPVPFTLIWLLFVFLSEKHKNPKYLLIAGISLGIGFYTYKGMRATVPIWVLLTCLYLFLKERKQSWSKLVWFLAGVAPFMAVIPALERKYPGAVFDEQGARWMPLYDFLYPYLSSFDPSYLYISGDATPWHSTGKHGMMLLATLPLFVVGVWEAIKRKGYWLFTLGAFLGAPALYGFVASVHRASRLLSMVPSYVLLCLLGAMFLWKKNKIVTVAIFAGMVVNYADFTHFYLYKYPELTRQWFGDLSYYMDYQTLGKVSAELQLSPYIDSGVASREDINATLFELMYLGERAYFLSEGEPLPENGILLSQREEIEDLKRLEVPSVKYYLHTNP